MHNACNSEISIRSRYYRHYALHKNALDLKAHTNRAKSLGILALGCICSLCAPSLHLCYLSLCRIILKCAFYNGFFSPSGYSATAMQRQECFTRNTPKEAFCSETCMSFGIVKITYIKPSFSNTGLLTTEKRLAIYECSSLLFWL